MEIHYSYTPTGAQKKKRRRPAPAAPAHMPSLRNRPPRSRSRILLTFFTLVFLGSILAGIAAIAWVSRDLPNPNKLMNRALPLSTKIYDRTGEHVLYDIHGTEQRTLVSLRDIPNYLKWATISAEDRGFYEHKGFDLRGIARAIFVDIATGKKAQGGSTITQQFIKNSLVGSRKTFARKFRELILAYQLEKNFTKDEILQLYFNEIPYGSTAYGAQSAAQMYFGKDVGELSLAESAILASLPKAPTYYSPWGNNREALLARSHAIINAMREEGYIVAEEAEAAKKEKVQFKKPGQQITAPHFVFHIREQLVATYGEQLAEEGGLQVITTLDFEKQKIAEEAIANGAKKNAAFNASNAALVSIDAHTGEILAMVGSRDYFNEEIDGNVNVVVQPRQPGSSFKPIVYAASWEKGYTPDTTLFDVRTNFDTTGVKEYAPQNYNGKEYGPVSMKKALAGSLNIAAVKTLYLTGVPTVLNFANRLNYTSLTEPNRYGLALVLGGAEVSLLEHASSFTAFARDGEVVKPSSILKVLDKNGAVLEETKPKKSRAFDPEIARQINDALSNNANRAYVFGARNHLTLPDRPAAGKTGTTNDFRDAWMIGYTPSVVTGVWVGNNRNAPMKNGADGSQLAAPIWNEYMRRVTAGTPVESFKKPVAVKTGKSMLDGGIGDEKKLKVDITTGKLATDLTPPEFVEEKVFRTVHTILYYVNKDDPRGPQPQNPAADPQFTAWEAAVKKWVADNKIEESEPPTESDDSRTPQLAPHISIIAPQEHETISQNPLRIAVETTAPRGVRRVEYYLDGTLIDIVTTPPFHLEYPIAGIESGFHTITVKSYDDIGNVGIENRTLNFLIRNSYPSVHWKTEQNTRLALGKTTPLTLTIETPAHSSSQPSRLTVLYTPIALGMTGTLANTGIQSNAISLPWTPQEAGEYILTAQLHDSANRLLSQKRIRVIVR